MSTTQPIRNKEALDRFKDYYIHVRPHIRNSMLVTLGLNTALRISDILSLRWGDVYDAADGTIRRHMEVREKKTGKTNVIAINRTVHAALLDYMHHVFGREACDPDRYLFLSQKGENTPICRSQAYRIIRTAAQASGLSAHISCHSMRKTFGYHAWKQGIPPALLMDIYNHSSYSITRRYLCIGQDEKDEVYMKISL